MPQYDLYYFNVRVLAEPIRQIFKLANVPFTDHRIPMEDFKEKWEHKTPSRLLPYLEVDGEKLPQSQSIARYIARQHGLAGKTPWEEAWVDALGDQFKDYWCEFFAFFPVRMGRKGFTGDLEKLQKQVEPAFKMFFGIIEKRLAESKSGFLVGDGVTWVDLLIADHVDQMLGKIPGYFDSYPKVREHQKKIHAIPVIKKWIEERPKGIF